jgi:hypothetical protein
MIGLDSKTRDWVPVSPFWACVCLDALDLFSNAISVAISATGIGIPAGAAFDLIFDALQTLLALAVFQSPAFALANPDFLLPQGFDIFPSYTAKFLAAELVE